MHRAADERALPDRRRLGAETPAGSAGCRGRLDDDVARDPAALDDFVRQMAGYADLGVHTAIVMPPGGSPAAWIDSVGSVVPQLADL
ncbi:hypothetical protein [Nocardia carnea]|uniref:hypothetical protein n=1 Tax=Nocardia carnea TaxID=37328 RepID=UPI0024562AD3|nr:hypothetical protein [Nocardia carnea]